jgi:SAM-dependent methyltransferase
MTTDSRPSVPGYGQAEAERYQRSAHGPDGKIFLDPQIRSYISTIQPDSYVIDVGAGAGPFSIEAAHRGAFVVATDNSKPMTERAKGAIEAAGLSDRVAVFLNHTRSLPFTDGSFDNGLSINVGCNLDSDTLNAHFRELRRVIREDGSVLFTTPTELGTVFTDGSVAAYNELMARLIDMEARLQDGEVITQELLQQSLGDLDSVRRATIVIKGSNIRLVHDGSEIPAPLTSITIPEAEIEDGEAIWRKIPGLVVPNRYHSIETYIDRISANGFEVEGMPDGRLDLPDVNHHNFNSSHEDSLGREYINKSPFASFVLRPVEVPAPQVGLDE